MKIKSVKILQIVAMALQILAIVIAVLITMGQENLKRGMTYQEEIVTMDMIPYGNFIQLLPIFVIYVIGFWVTGNTDENRTKVKAGILLAVACLAYVGTSNQVLITSFIARTGGASALAAYSVLQSLITQYTNPLHLIAFALFCFALGGYVRGDVQEV